MFSPPLQPLTMLTKYKFTERLAKGMWFFFPMGVALFINFAAFVSILHSLIKMSNSLKEFRLKTKKDQNQQR